MEIRQSEEYVGKDWWEWSVWIDGSPNELDRIEFVEWQLHPTFPEPIRRVTDRSSNFKLQTGGWGVFPINASVRMKGGETIKLRHKLELHYPDGTGGPS